ncbi:MAG: hypothetical protein HRU41_23130 [Saprospiraceae bacterium]|nr:hypothetical protein [Saprospiraceae bacterium]
MDIRGKEKKISVKFVPNKVSKPLEPKDSKEKLFPLYIRVTFDGTSTRFPYFISLPLAQTLYISDEGNFYMVSSDEDSTTRRLPKEQIEAETKEYTNRLKEVIRYEYGVAPLGKYHVKGIFKRFIRYNKKLKDILCEEASEALRAYLEDHLTYRRFNEMLDYSTKNSWLYPAPLFSDYYFIHSNPETQLQLTGEITEKIKATAYFYLYEETQLGKNKTFVPSVLFDWIIGKSTNLAFRNFLSNPIDFECVEQIGEKNQFFTFAWDKISKGRQEDLGHLESVVNELIINGDTLQENLTSIGV